MIALVNRRFVLFYFNVGKGQEGYDLEAASFVSLFDDRFAGGSVPTPPVWVFSPEEELLTTIDNYRSKDEFFEALMAILSEHPQLNRPTRAEVDTLEGSDGVAAALLAQQLGDYALAKKLYRAASQAEPVAGHLGLARIARYEDDAERVDAELRWLEQQTDDESPFADDVSLERAHRQLDAEDYPAARTTLGAGIRRWPASPRMGERHFYAGVAAFFQGERDWANFHWCWVMENIPDDYNYMRCYLAATADAMPYPNPELGGYRGEANTISHALADAARDRALADYRRLRRIWEEPR